jgi:hypothetical protein
MATFSKEQVWVMFAASAAARVSSPEGILGAAAVADRMVAQWDARFGDAMFLLEGQSECAACKKPLPPDAEYIASGDAVKFCTLTCLQASGREA